jgi:hypothetical protein
MHLRDYQPSPHRVDFYKNKITILLAWAGIIINLTLLAIAWFAFKEKEA